MSEINQYNSKQTKVNKTICNTLQSIISASLPKAESKIWYSSPVWFRDGYPLVGYTVKKTGISLLFWSGQSFDEPELKKVGKYKAAEKIYITLAEINETDLKRWLKKSWTVVWDYKNIIKNKGKLDSLVHFS